MNSRDYWKKREAEQLARNIRDEAQYIKVINGYYDYMMDQVQREINGFYTKYAKSEGITMPEARKRVSELDIKVYQRKAKRYVANKTLTKEANAEMKIYNATMKINRLEMLKANIGLELVDGFDDLQKYFDKVLTDRTLAEFERQAGILGGTIRDNQKAAHAIVNASYKNASFSDRIWMYQDMLKAELSKLLRTGLIQGRNPRELARHLSKLFGVSKSDTVRLMRTELARVQIEAQRQSYERFGYEEYVFIAEATACPDCKALDDGKPHKTKDMMPGTNAPPIHANCRCSTAAYMEREKFDKWLQVQEAYSEAMKNEPEITKLLQNIATDTDTQLKGLEYRLKTPDSISRKLKSEPDKKIRDALRYTYELPTEEYVDKYNKIIERLVKKGYTVSAVKNYWSQKNNPYNGLNTNLFSKGNYEFEVQYHTKESLSVKEEIHKLYERWRILEDKSSQEAVSLRQAMLEISAQMSVPEGVDEVR